MSLESPRVVRVLVAPADEAPGPWLAPHIAIEIEETRASLRFAASEVDALIESLVAARHALIRRGTHLEGTAK